MDRRTSDRRRGTALAALAAAWALAVAVAYFWPTAADGVRAIVDGSLPDAALTREPLRRVGSIAAAAGIFLAAWGYGSTLRALLPEPRGGLEGVLMEMGIGTGALYLLALGLSPLQLLRPGVLVAITVVGVVLAMLNRPRTLSRPRLPAGVVERSSLALVAAAGVFALIGALAPEVEYDALWYHLDLPKRYLDAGALVDFRCQYVAHYPSGTELLFGYGLALGDQIAAKLIHFGLGVLLVLATYRLGTQVSSRRAALLAAAILAVTPTVTWEATTAYVELGTAFFVVLALSGVIRYAEDPSRGTLALAGLFAGFALATKTLALIAVAPLGVLVLFAARGRPLRRLAAGGGFLGVALLPALPWYLRAQIETGNPVFPSAYGLFGADADVWTAQADAAQQAFYDHFGFRDGPGSLLALPWDVTMHGAAFGGSLGVAYLMLVPLALRVRPSRAFTLTALFCVGYLALWASPLSSLQLRFVVPVLGPLAVVAAAGFDAAWQLARERAPAAGSVLAVVVLAALALALPPFVALHEPDGEGTLTHVLSETPLDVVTGAETEDAYIARRVPAYPAIQRLNRLAGPGDRVVMAIDPFANYYSQAELIPDFAVCLARAGLYGHGPGAAWRALAKTGVDYVLVDQRVSDAWSLDWLDADLRRIAFTSIFADGRVRLLRVRVPAASHARLHAGAHVSARRRSRSHDDGRSLAAASPAADARPPAADPTAAATRSRGCGHRGRSALRAPASAATRPTAVPDLAPAAG
jgi:4-amino-4-deoxy-L-arabinose transferase-like glycosyltransferase